MKFTLPSSRFTLPSRITAPEFLKTDVIHERLFALGGMGIAATISGIAYFEVQNNQGVIAINGADHFAVFAKPALYHEERVRVAELTTVPPPSLFDPIGRTTDGPANIAINPPASSLANLSAGVDYEATASITVTPAPMPPPRSVQPFANSVTASIPPALPGRGSESPEVKPDIFKKSTNQPYSLQSVTEHFAVFRNADGKIMVRTGESIPGIGRVNAIVKRQGRWVAVITRE